MNILKLFQNKKPSTKTKCIDGIEYKYQKKKNSKHIKITIKNRSLVNVTLPFYASYKTAEAFVREKENWIKENIKRAKSDVIEENFFTETNNLTISKAFVQKPLIKKEGRNINFMYPFCADFYSDEIQSELKKAVKLALYIEAKEYLPKRLEYLAQKYGFKYNRVFLKAHKTRWGSCSARNNINLNINLMKLNKNLIDYVLVHELCHTVEKNHQKDFWLLLCTCIENAKDLRCALKKERMTV